jgi:hypothetical protein
VCLRKNSTSSKKIKKITLGKGYLLNIKRICISPFNEFTLISVHVDESEFIKFDNSDEIELGPPCI